MTPEEALALGEFPPDQLPLAAADQTKEEKTANLIRMKDGVVHAFDPLGLEIYGRSGALTISGRILGFPEKMEGSTLICFLDVNGQKPLSPLRHEWKEETGDFLVEFNLEEGLKGRLKAAVVFEAAKD